MEKLSALKNDYQWPLDKAQRDEAHDAFDAAVNSVLTDEQKARWQERKDDQKRKWHHPHEREEKRERHENGHGKHHDKKHERKSDLKYEKYSDDD